MHALKQEVPPRPDADIAFWTEKLLADGYAVIPGAADLVTVESLDADFARPFAETPFSQGFFFGEKTVCFGRALIPAPHAATLVQHRLILGMAEAVLGPYCNGVQLNLTQGLAVHPGAPAQLPHRDEDMWPGPKGVMEYMMLVLWPFTRFTPETGATRIWRGSHRLDRELYVGDERCLSAVANPGDAIVWLGSTLQGQGENSSDEIRRGMAVSYSLSWLKQYENQYLALA